MTKTDEKRFIRWINSQAKALKSRYFFTDLGKNHPPKCYAENLNGCIGKLHIDFDTIDKLLEIATILDVDEQDISYEKSTTFDAHTYWAEFKYNDIYIGGYVRV